MTFQVRIYPPDLDFPHFAVDPDGEPKQIAEDLKGECPYCAANLQPDPAAYKLIHDRRMCEVTQTIVHCPECSNSVAFFSKGEPLTEITPEGLLVGEPENGWWISRIKINA